jgi:hypothetical protein
MAELKPFASLSSGLLARKGAAKPAMRPQGFGQMGVSMEDLGWNDMGHAPQAPAPSEERYDPRPEHVPSSIAALTPAPRSHLEPQQQPQVEPVPIVEPTPIVQEAPIVEQAPPPPPVVEQQRAIEEHFAERVEEPKAAAPAPRYQPKSNGATAPKAPRERRARGAKEKSAFTLRLDSDRHLKLRLACALTHRSAQMIVTEALDGFLVSIPELEALAGHLPAKAAKRN